MELIHEICNGEREMQLKGNDTMKAISNWRKGFTLIELMVALAITSILLAGIYTTYMTQLKSHLTQQLMVEMQQSLRGAMQLMEREIRMAGYDPANAGAGIVTMQANTFRFTMDLDGDGNVTDPDEDVRYAINAAGSLGREVNGGGGLQPLAEFIDALNFVYLDANGNVVSNPMNASNVKSVQVTMVARSSQTVPVMFFKKTDNQTYQNQQGTNILLSPNDQFRRMMITSDIVCRNL
ncbi:MAG: prepilin-type N-terminal cleavage/methylation domain-containing protein [Thermodesulfobacteriota bacterium]|nr:prepilin-type N-terminal cleavage/methylation domain-containing protein [Thermodesulfobacteriota bacterium]